MNKRPVIFLQTVIILIGLSVLFLLIRLPQTEGRAKNLDLFHIYADPFILYGYAASIPFFIGLYKVFRLLGYIRQDKMNTFQAIVTLRSIRYCAVVFGILIIGAWLFIRFFHHKEDDPAGFLAICTLVTFASALVANTAVRHEKKLKKGMEGGR